MKLKNGFGTVYKMKGTRRNPFVVKISKEGKQKPIGYTPTYEDGLALLLKYHDNPSLFSKNDITFKQVYELFKSEKFPAVSNSTKSSDYNSFKHSKPLWDKHFASLRLSDLQEIINSINNSGIGYSTQKKVRNLYHQMYSYAIKYDVTDKDYSLFITIAKDDKHKKKLPFNTRQLNKVKLSSDPFKNFVILGCYTGLRPSELLNLRSEDIKLRQKYLIVTKSKTKAGENRAVPLHKCIMPFIELAIHEGNSYVIGGPEKLSYGKFRSKFVKFMKELHLKHTPHEMRHTFATRLNDSGANPFTIKMLMGHAGTGVTEKHYTHKNIHELRKAINLLK